MVMLDKVRQTIARWDMISPGMTVLVGVSGGPDSVALLDILVQLRDELQISLCVAHLNHKLRGPEADADAEYVKELAGRYDIPAVVEEADVAAYRKEHGLSMEEAAREVRYRFFARALGHAGADRVALGHQANDQAETILFNMIRGTGLAGLAGIPPVRGLYVRPLIEVTRREIEQYCTARGLNPRTDSSNLNVEYTRNRIRKELIPYLEREFNNDIVASLLRTGEICRGEEAYLEEQAAKSYRAVLRDKGNESITLNIAALMDLPLAIQRRVVRLAWAEASGSRGLAFLHVERVLALASRRNGASSLHLPGDIVAECQYDTLLFRASAYERGPFHFVYTLRVPGCTYIPELDVSLWTEIWQDFTVTNPGGFPANEAVVDYDRVKLPLKVRTRRKGDIFEPYGLKGRLKLKKFFINIKMPRRDRDQTPLVVDNRERIVWVGGQRIADFCKLTGDTRKVLFMRLLPGSPGFE
ncbi:MAG: tRNA lysidine(34) synthetase TilS [Peptococcaceae bacterium]|nr:tRNA lysidine(34) synthetase TilS [Peptococcaceae bacterium]